MLALEDVRETVSTGSDNCDAQGKPGEIFRRKALENCMNDGSIRNRALSRIFGKGFSFEIDYSWEHIRGTTQPAG